MICRNETRDSGGIRLLDQEDRVAATRIVRPPREKRKRKPHRNALQNEDEDERSRKR